MREYVLSYEFDEGCWMITIMAESALDAAERVKAIRRSVVLVDSGESSTLMPVEQRAQRQSFG